MDTPAADAKAVSGQPIRPIWVASYPRSGNTFLRIILERIFRLPSYSMYRVEGQNIRDPSAEALEDAPFLPRDWRQLVSDAAEARLTPIKTHDLPEDQRSAIYIIRDGRAAIDSYYHYHKQFAFEQPSLTEVIAGACQFGPWSAHYLGWAPRTRPNTLFLTYEELVGAPEQVIPRLAQFLGLPAAEGRVPSFAELRQKVPAFFRRGQNQDFLSAWTPRQLALFNCLHGSVAQELGYGGDHSSETVDELGAELAHSAARLHKRYVQELHNQGLSLAARAELARALEERGQEIERLSERVQSLSALLRNWWVKVGLGLHLVRRPQEPKGAEKDPALTGARHSPSKTGAASSRVEGRPKTS